MKSEEKMEENKMIEGLSTLPPPTSMAVAIAINGGRKSKYIVKWALDEFVPEGIVVFKLFHVRPKIDSVPTPMGNFIPISQVREDVAAAYIKEIEWQTSKKILPYKNMCAKSKVEVEVVLIESDDIVDAIAAKIANSTITKLVIGASSRGLFSRGSNLSSKISECIPSFCTVYVVSNGKLSSLRPSDSETIRCSKDDSSETSSTINSGYPSTSQEWTGSATSHSCFRSPSLPQQRFQSLSTINQNLHRRAISSETPDSKYQTSFEIEEEAATSSSLSNSDSGNTIVRASSFLSLAATNQSLMSDQPESQVNIDFEVEKLRVELRHIQGMFAVAQSETLDASRKLSDLQRQKLEKEIKRKESNLKEKEAEEVAKQEKMKFESMRSEAEYMKECVEREAAERKEAEAKASRVAKEKENLENALMSPTNQYRKFEWEEIVSATSSFSENLRIGIGGNGIVYKGSFHHTVAAVKVLHSGEAHRTKQFQQELDILSNIRHPHLLILLGACPENGCLVYEFMENGNLDERLLRKNGTPPIPWFDRYRIAWEVGSALAFLHNTSPKPIIHRDLKPENILLDRNFVSKIGDVGLSTMLDSGLMYKETGPKGTFCYIDPEYQRTGLISPESDIYAFGLVILRLLTGKPAIGLTHLVETAVDGGFLTEVLDSEAGEWPLEETMELAVLGLKCAEIRRRDRPDLNGEVVPALERLREVADRARDLAAGARAEPPNHFICPILKEVMEEPCVAADGYTYERRAIEEWIEKNGGKSPLTNKDLPTNNLIPNYALLSAIMEWKSAKR